MTRTLIQSDSTRVPPVTAERSPPDSRMTGADSPVIADSSTDATPSMISPSAGMNSPALTMHDVALAQRRRRHRLDACRPARSRFATVSVRALRSVSACALPRPFGHRLGEVGEQHGEPEPERDLQLEAEARPPVDGVERRAAASSARCRPRRRTSPGFFAIVRGCSLRSASPIARADDLRIPDRSLCVCVRHQNTCPCVIRKCSTIGPRLSAGKNVSAPTMTMTPTSSAENSGVVTGNVPGDGGTRFLRPRLPAIASIGMIMKNRPNSIASAERRCCTSACSRSGRRTPTRCCRADVKA